MSPNLPRQDLRNSPPRRLFTTVVIAILILLGLYVLVTYMMEDSDPDRPPIIISSGSVTVTSGGDWTDRGGKGYKQDIEGKSVKTFAAATGAGGSACMVQGETIVVTYGTYEISVTRKRRFPFPGFRYAAFVQFPADANVSQPAQGQLLVTTDAALVSFRNENGNSCNVQAGTLTIQQQH